LSVFLPILALMLALAALIGEETNPHGLRAAVLVGSAIAAAILILARQLGARYEIRTLYRTLAGKEAEAKLTELVRRSSDLIVVVKEGGELAYVSPAADKILGRSAHSLQSTPAAAMLGPDNQARLTNFLADIAQRHAPSTEMEAVIATPAGSQRTVCIVGSDQSTNPAIEGITLTLRDVTEQRRLEGEVLEISAREQQRLSSDIHEGLGQDLTGISLLLKSLEKDAYRDPTAFAGFLQVIVGHVNRTIDTARNLATGLAPMQISRGSLDVALTNLVAEARTRFQLRLNLQISLCGYEIGAVEADHWYRIAREAINNAARHGRCRVIDVELATHDNRIVLIVADDGIGMDKTTSSTSGLGLRMIAYRARVMGGVMHLGTSVTGGAQILVSVPMSVAEPRLRAPDDERRGNISLH
jgi:PAS domain S-box-containing protein